MTSINTNFAKEHFCIHMEDLVTYNGRFGYIALLFLHK